MKISVVIPMHNREKTIINCLESVVNQTYKPYEVIVVDDCSSDDSVKVVNEYNHELVRVITCSENGGAQKARNIGIEAAKGDWIAFNDSDDEWIPQKLEKQVAEIHKTGYAICSGGARVKTKNKEYEWFCRGKSGYIYDNIMTFKEYIFFPTLLMKKDLLYNIGALDEKVLAYQELDMAIRLTKNEKVAFIEEPLFIYDITGNDNISKNKQKGIEARKYLWNKYQKDIMNGPEDYRIAWYRALAGEYGWKSLLFYKNCINWLMCVLKKRIVC